MTLSHSPNIVRDGLVLYLDAANIKSYPRSGTTWMDLTGNGKNGTLINGPSYSSSNNGSVVFDGANDLIFLPNSSTILPLPNMSWEIVFKSPGIAPGMNSAGLLSLNYGMVSKLTNVGNIFFTIWDGNSQALGMVTSGYNYFDNKWHHAVFIINGSTGYIYVDGVLVKTQSVINSNRTGTNIWSEMPMRFPDDPNDIYYKFQGSIGGIKIYNRGLSDSEVKQNFNALRGRYGI